MFPRKLGRRPHEVEKGRKPGREKARKRGRKKLNDFDVDNLEGTNPTMAMK